MNLHWLITDVWGRVLNTMDTGDVVQHCMLGLLQKRGHGQNLWEILGLEV